MLRAAANPAGRTVDLSWDLPDPAADPESVPVTVLRRERRFPGRGRRGVIPVPATGADLTDGVAVAGPAGDAPQEVTEERADGDHRVLTVRRYALAGQPRDRVFTGSVRREYQGVTPVRTTVRIIDRDGLEPGTIYYYTAFAGPHRLYSRLSQDAALVTAGGDGRLYRGLPRVDRMLDTTAAPAGTVPSADAGKGQLERFLDVIDGHAALLAGLTSGLRDLHDVRRADSRVLAGLSDQLGWRLKDHLDEDTQRNEVAHAPFFHRSVGTGRNVAAMVNRLTGWDARVRDFVTNVLCSWDASRVEQLETGPVYLDGGPLFPGGGPVARTVSAGSLDTTDPAALYRMRTRSFDDTGAYTYDCGRDDTDVYSRETVGIYVVPDGEAETFGYEQEWRRAREVVEEFLPVGVRVVFLLRPGLAAEEPYDATVQVGETALDTGRLLETEAYGEGGDTGLDAIPDWAALETNEPADRSVDTAAAPVDTRSRSWHTAVMRPAG